MNSKFSLGMYRELLSCLIGSGRMISGFTSLPPNRALLLRCDIDFDLSFAVAVAEINREQGVAATFFVLMDSELYNPFAVAERAALRRLVDCGQRVALHFFHEGPETPNRASLREQLALLRVIVPEADAVVAWHNPSGNMDALNAVAAEEGFVSAYDRALFGVDRYVSDSNGRNTPRQILAAVAACQAPVMQVLLHPFYWVVGGAHVDEILCRTFAHKVQHLMNRFDDNRIWRARTGETIRQSLTSLWWYGSRSKS